MLKGVLSAELIANKKTYKSKNLTGKGKYIIKVVNEITYKVSMKIIKKE